MLALSGTEAQLIINGRPVSAPAVDDTQLVVNGDAVSAVPPGLLSAAAAAAASITAPAAAEENLDIDAAASESVGVGGRVVINGEPVALSAAAVDTPVTINGGDEELTVEGPNVGLDTRFATNVGTAVEETPPLLDAGATRPGRRQQQVIINGNRLSLSAAAPTVTVTSVIFRTVVKESAPATVTADATRSPASPLRPSYVPVGVSGKSRVVLLMRPTSTTFRPWPSSTLIQLPQTSQPGRVKLGLRPLPPPLYYLPPAPVDRTGHQQYRRGQGAGASGTFSFLSQPQSGSTVAQQSSGERANEASPSHAGPAESTERRPWGALAAGGRPLRLTVPPRSSRPAPGGADIGRPAPPSSYFTLPALVGVIAPGRAAAAAQRAPPSDRPLCRLCSLVYL